MFFVATKVVNIEHCRNNAFKEAGRFKKLTINVNFKFECFPISFYRALPFKEIYIVYNWPRPSTPLIA